jgi:hypothetical protein
LVSKWFIGTTTKQLKNLKRKKCTTQVIAKFEENE